MQGREGFSVESRLDDLARSLAGERVSRRRVLRRFGGVMATVALWSAPGTALARRRRCAHHRVPCRSVCCPAGAHCRHGKCKCPKGTVKCGSRCVRRSADPHNCGRCGHRCAAGEACVAGTCRHVSSGQGTSGQTSTQQTPTQQTTTQQTQTQPTGTEQPSPTCTDGIKNGAETDVDCGGPSCPACAGGKTCLQDTDCQAGTCLNGHCGVCTPGDVQPCYTGPPGSAGVGICHWGTQTCSAAGAWGPCTGEQTPQPEVCNNLDDDCDGMVDENFDLQHDPQNCGMCGHVCSAPNAIMGCSNGHCVITACHAGFSDCNGNPADGCEVDLNDNNTCGGCTTVCPEGTTCVNQVCQ